MKYAEGLEKLRRGPRELWYRRDKRGGTYFLTTCSFCGQRCFVAKRNGNGRGPRFCDHICSFRGEHNPRWNGGTSEYPKHAALKIVRLEAMIAYNGQCGVCRKPANKVHHRNGDKSDHRKANLIPLCNHCHGAVCQSLPRETSKYRKLYGMTLRDMAELMGMVESTARKRLLSSETQAEFLSELAKKRKMEAA